MRVKSLEQRFTLFILVPVALLLLTMGMAGFRFARDLLLSQWSEATILKLQRAAHHIDMQLKRPKEMLELFNRTAGQPHAMHIQALILSQLKAMEGITGVELRRADPEPAPVPGRRTGSMGGRGSFPEPVPMGGMMPFHRGAPVKVEPPRYDTPSGSGTVTLVSDLKDARDATVGQVRVKMKFDALVDTVAASGWWQDQTSLIVDNAGTILAGNTRREQHRLGETGDPLERSTLDAMQNRPFGTLLGEGFPPSRVSGFYTLAEARWTLVVLTPGGEILEPIVRFRLYFLGIGAAFTVLILLLIRFVTGRVVASIKGVSRAAKRVAAGDYRIELSSGSKDEVGELVESFNTMVHQLEERTRMKASLNLAREVQQNLFPAHSLSAAGIEVVGKSVYCDETGGDYYDFFDYSDKKRVGVAVGDVSGHGVASALLMATVRAMIRSHERGAEDPAGMITAVNRRLCDDTAKTGDFVTLFYLLYDGERREIQWVRAGHDPALLYDPESDAFVELGGRGLALGVDEGWEFTVTRRTGVRYGQILLIGTDGIWEAQNDAGERFGKKRLRRVIRKHSYACANRILTAIMEALARFRQTSQQEDDITLVVIKATSRPRNLLAPGCAKTAHPGGQSAPVPT